MNKCKSSEELHFMWFLDELLETGYIYSYDYEPEPIVLNKPLFIKYKNKKSIKSLKLIPERKYTYDFRIVWNVKAAGIFYVLLLDDTLELTGLQFNKKLIPAQIRPISYDDQCTHQNECNNQCENFDECKGISYGVVSHIEVKGSFDNHNMTRLAKNNIAYVWDKYDLYIHLIKTYEFFGQFYYPKRMNYTDNNPTRLRKRKGKLIKDLDKMEDYIKRYDEYRSKQGVQQTKQLRLFGKTT